MVTRGSWKRFRKYGLKELFLSLYLWIPALIVGVVFFGTPGIFSQRGMRNFVNAATGISQSLIAVTLTGLAILVSFSDKDFLAFFRDEGGFDELLAIFEYTVTLSLITTLAGALLQSLSYDRWVFYIFFALFLHLLASVSALVSTILRFGKSKADYDAIDNIDEEDVPEELKEDLESVFDENKDS
ncbi:hypothetical protein NGM10_04325 [Halorussus salilacus]|uniref:hypothetical protein n=1 Tax=Halorussus salilacus TaxID=2953750 RepID=UPI00209DB72E|nr:hypothetical protein [Halorussus salilacus]USZ68967.1 hypothetical protein NGM10_04325 [Halorussus salilacus]